MRNVGCVAWKIETDSAVHVSAIQLLKVETASDVFTTSSEMWVYVENSPTKMN